MVVCEKKLKAEKLRAEIGKGWKTGDRSQKTEVRRSVRPGSGKEDRICWISGWLCVRTS
jgi:hypothetical protein